LYGGTAVTTLSLRDMHFCTCALLLVLLLQDFRTAYITQTHPTAMFVAQLVGTAMGVVFAPLVFFMFWSTGLVGCKDGP
jgi:uncharacterized oligopeptide transporter (OPT) family protein